MDAACSRILLRVLVADPLPAVNDGLTLLLSRLEGIAVFGCAQESDKVLALVAVVRPDVVVLDLERPVNGGLRVVKQIKQSSLAPVVMVLSHYPEPALRQACRAAGADCFFEKTAAFEEIEQTLEGMVAARRAGQEFNGAKP
jgi:DNA-binding NarL/FixJ family response regulator